MNKLKKITEFEGYVSGDYECFCLSKVPFEEWARRERTEINVVYPDPLLLYPNAFFPEKTKQGKWKFKITVEATKI